MGEEYLLEELADQEPGLKTGGAQYSRETMYWAGYIYRYWHYLTGEASKQIYRQSPAATMNQNYFMFHTLVPELAIENLKEIYRQSSAHRRR